MAKKDKKSKATESSKKAQKAIKEQKAIVVSEFAVEGEDPKWGAQLDNLRLADQAAGMTKDKALRVQRQQRVRVLAKGKTLPAHGGLMELDNAGDSLELTTSQPEVEIVEPPLPEGMAPVEPQATEDTYPTAHVLAVGSNDSADPNGPSYIVEGPDGEPVKLGKKERKALAKQQEAERVAAEEAAEAARAAAAVEPEPELSKKAAKKAAKQLAKEQEAVVAKQPVPKAVESMASTPAVPMVQGEAPGRVRRDALQVALSEAQVKANESGKKVQVVGPREYTAKNYGARLQEKFIEEFPGLEYISPDEFNTETGKFRVKFRVVPQN